jgi:hypothetical protein
MPMKKIEKENDDHRRHRPPFPRNYGPGRLGDPMYFLDRPLYPLDQPSSALNNSSIRPLDEKEKQEIKNAEVAVSLCTCGIWLLFILSIPIYLCTVYFFG